MSGIVSSIWEQGGTFQRSWYKRRMSFLARWVLTQCCFTHENAWCPLCSIISFSKITLFFVLFLRAYETRKTKSHANIRSSSRLTEKAWPVTQECCHFSSSSVLDWSLLVALSDDWDANWITKELHNAFGVRINCYGLLVSYANILLQFLPRCSESFRKPSWPDDKSSYESTSPILWHKSSWSITKPLL